MPSDMQETFNLLEKTRQNILAVLATKSLEQLNTVPAGFNNNLIWNAGHVVATSELLVYALSGHRTPSGRDFVDRYRKGSRPGSPVEEEEYQYIRERLSGGAQALAADLDALDWSNYNPYRTSFGVEVSSVEGALRFNNLHESLHLGTMMALRRLV